MIHKKLKIETCSGSTDSYIEGNEKSSNLAVLVPGMLYDINNPPKNSVLSTIQRNIADISLNLVVNKIDYDSDCNKYELAIDEQVSRIQSAMEVVKSDFDIERIIYITHSIGSLVVRRLVQLDSSTADQDFIFLVPPSPFRDEKTQVKLCTEKFMPVIPCMSDKQQTAYRARDGSNFIIDNKVWNSFSIMHDDERYPSNAQYVVATHDNAFPYSCNDIYREMPQKTTVIDDTHSIKKEKNSDVILEYIKQILDDNIKS